MRKFILLGGIGLCFASGPAVACDLDGMFGPHRFNAFGNFGGQSMFETDPQPAPPPQVPEPKLAESNDPVEPATRPTTFASLTEQLDKEPAEPSAAERVPLSQQPPARGDDNRPAPSAMFR